MRREGIPVSAESAVVMGEPSGQTLEEVDTARGDQVEWRIPAGFRIAGGRRGGSRVKNGGDEGIAGRCKPAAGAHAKDHRNSALSITETPQVTSGVGGLI